MNCSQCPVHQQSVFRDLGPAALASIEAQKSERTLRRGEVLFSSSDAADRFYCNRSSFFKIGQRSSGAEQEVIVRLAPPGDCLGHRSVFHRKNYLGRAQALQEGEICQLPRPALQALMVSHPELAQRLLEKLSQEISDCEERLQLGHQHSVRQRLAALLLRTAKAMGARPAGENSLALKLPLSRRELAALVPTSLETLVREFSQFKREGVLQELGEHSLLLSIDKFQEILSTEKQ